MPKSWGLTYVALIPKKDNPKLVIDFCSISLCNVCYKLIAKIFANRLKLVLPNLIGKEQSGFFQGRLVVDNIIAIQEGAHSLEHDFSNPPRMIVKIDIEKTYDTLSWKAIIATLTKMNYPTIWFSWIHICISSPSFAFLINGQLTRFISTLDELDRETACLLTCSLWFLKISSPFLIMLSA